MKRTVILLFVLTLLNTSAYAMEPFIGTCKGNKAHKYEIDSGRNNFDPVSEWSTENWWDEDRIEWTGKELLLNYGKMKAGVIDVKCDVIRAMYTDFNNVYLITLDKQLGALILTQQQSVPEAQYRRIQTRTTCLKCKFRNK